jgi:hypothetical protein
MLRIAAAVDLKVWASCTRRRGYLQLSCTRRRSWQEPLRRRRGEGKMTTKTEGKLSLKVKGAGGVKGYCTCC